MAATWPLTGRAEELRRISGWIRRRDGPAGVVLAGTAGVGKTRLAREALAAEQRRGTVIRWAVATVSARVLSLGAFAAMLGVVGPDPSQLVLRRAAAVVLTLRTGETAPDAVTALGCGTSPGVTCSTYGSWWTANWNPAGCARSPGCGGGQGNQSCRRAWSS